MNVPSKKFLKKFLGHDVYLVDGSWLRKNFTEFGDFLDAGVHGASHVVHWLFPSIPKNEIWVADELNLRERDISIAVAGELLKHIANGLPIKEASKLAKAANKLQRKKNAGKPDKVRKSVYMVLDGVTIHIVRGEQVRDTHDPHFIEGGHGYVYDYVPKNEIWIDDTLDPDEITPVYLHEFSERHLMKSKGMSYDDAHERAIEIEYHYRQGRMTEWLQEWSKTVGNRLTFEFLLDLLRNTR
jgi:hypothetical protein